LRTWEWPQARAALGRAQARLAGGAPAELRRRVEEMGEHLDLADRLDGIRLRAAVWVEGDFDYRSADRDFARLFRQRGLGVQGEDPQAVAARIQASPAGAQLVAALDFWAVATQDRARRGWLLEVARRAEPGSWGERFRDPAVWQKPAALRQLARQASVAELSPPALTALAEALRRAQVDALPLLRAARERHPTDFWLNFLLGNALLDEKRPEAVGYYLVALVLRPNTIAVYNNLGVALKDKGDLEGAIQCYQKAIALDPKFAMAHTNLGAALRAKGDVGGAIACYQKAIAIDPKFANAHINLGSILCDVKRDFDGAIACFQKAIGADPKNAKAHTHLGLALEGKGQMEGAIACFRKAIALQPKYALAHTNLGTALKDKGDLGGAIASFQKAIALDPKDAQAHYNLGNALYAKGDLGGAIACFKKAIALQPKYAEAHCNLGHALQQQGSFPEALRYLKAGHELGSRRKGWRYPSAAWVQTAQRLVALDGKLLKVLRGKAQPKAAAERLALADLAQQRYKRQYAFATRLYAEAFAEQPKLADDPRQWHRYNAACSAVLAAARRAADAEKVPDKARLPLRRQALHWLQADLARYAKMVQGDKPAAQQAVRQRLAHWQGDADLASVRAKDALAKLPEGERKAWQKLWADVADLLSKAQGK
jgi:tetratricopeptide (TPR) repeat protein